MMLGTHGAFSGGVIGPLKRELTAKGFCCFAARIIPMPDNFFPFGSDAANRTKLEAGIMRAVRYAEEMNAGKTSWTRWAILADIYAAILGSFFACRKLSRRYFSTVHIQRKQCRRCGICVRFCPANALEQKDDSFPCVTKKCMNCLRCVAICPHDAMRHMKGFHPYRSEEAGTLKSRFEE